MYHVAFMHSLHCLRLLPFDELDLPTFCSTFIDDTFFERLLDRVSDEASLLGSFLVQGAVAVL